MYISIQHTIDQWLLISLELITYLSPFSITIHKTWKLSQNKNKNHSSFQIKTILLKMYIHTCDFFVCSVIIFFYEILMSWDLFPARTLKTDIFTISRKQVWGEILQKALLFYISLSVESYIHSQLMQFSNVLIDSFLHIHIYQVYQTLSSFSVKFQQKKKNLTRFILQHLLCCFIKMGVNELSF